MEEKKQQLLNSIDGFARLLAAELGRGFGDASVHALDQIAMLRKLKDLREELRTGKAYQ